jgi:hypothetical protein
VYLYNTAQTTPRPPLAYWASQHAWYFVFLSGNSIVFWLSMQSSTKQSLIESLHDWVVVGKIGWMTIAGSWVCNYNFNNPTVSVSDHPVRWGAALIVPMIMNLLALYHTLSVLHQQPWYKEAVWIIMDLLAVAFYAVILLRLGNPTRLDPPNLAFLWPRIVLPLVILILIDVIVLRTRVGLERND